MAQYVTPSPIREPVPVGITDTVIVPVTSLRGSDAHLVELVNDGVEPLNAYVEVSFDGNTPFFVLPDSGLDAIAVNAARPMRVLAEFQFYRVRGNFSTTPGTVRRSVAVLKNMAHK
jgi:hypothetical protein